MSFLGFVVLLSLIQSCSSIAVGSLPTSRCGLSPTASGSVRIVGGEAVPAHSWTWTVSLFQNGVFWCGGSILSSSWIVTAAHCLTYSAPSDWIVATGPHLLNTTSQRRVVSEFVIHPEYDKFVFVNDIALIKLMDPLDMSDPLLGTICLPSHSSLLVTSDEWPSHRLPAVAVGWGRLKENGPLPQDLLQVNLEIVSEKSSECTADIEDWHTQLCAGVATGDKDTCQGDSGGPLMIHSSSKQWVLVGLTSSGVGCAAAPYSGIYTRVAAYLDWIDQHTHRSYLTADNSPKVAVDWTFVNISALISTVKDLFTQSRLPSHLGSSGTRFASPVMIVFVIQLVGLSWI